MGMVDGKNNSVGIVHFLDFDLTPTVANAVGRLKWNADDGTLEFGMAGGLVVQQIGTEGLVKVKARETITNGDLVYVSGASGNNVEVLKASNDDVTKATVLGMATEDIADNANGYVALWGKVRGLALPSPTYAEGDRLYLGLNGGFTLSNPSGATDSVVIIGQVTRVGASTGEITITNIQSFTLGNNHDVTLRMSIINNNTGTASASGFTAVNDAGHFATMGVGGSNNAGFPDKTVFYGMGYGDNLYAVDGNKSHKWFNDPTDSHNNSSLAYLGMELYADGSFALPRATEQKVSIGGETLSKITAKKINTVLNAEHFQIENLLSYSEDFTDGASPWIPDASVLQAGGAGAWSFWQPTGASGFLSRVNIPVPDGARVTMNLRCKGATYPDTLDRWFKFKLIDDSGNDLFERGGVVHRERLNPDHFNTVQFVGNAPVDTSGSGTVDFIIENSTDTLDNATLYIDYAEMYTSLAPAIFNEGDSIATGSNKYLSDGYAQRFLEEYNCDVKHTAAGGDYLSEIRDDIETEKNTNAKYPMVFIEGGVNDIGAADGFTPSGLTPAQMAAVMVEAANFASIMADRVLVLTCPLIPNWKTGEAWCIGHTADAIEFNGLLETGLADNPFVTLIDVNSVLDNELGSLDYADAIHWNENGHSKVFNLMNEAVDFPPLAATHRYITTTTAAIPAIEIGMPKPNIDGRIKQGILSAIDDNEPLYFTVGETILQEGGAFQSRLPRIQFEGYFGLAGAKIQQGAFANGLYIHGDDGANPVLNFTNWLGTISFSITMDRITGAVTVSNRPVTFLGKTIHPDSVKSIYGTGEDYEFFWNGSAMVIKAVDGSPADLIVWCGTEKTLVLADPVYDDKQSSLLSNQLTTPAADIVRNVVEASLTFKTTCDIGDYVYMTPQMPHTWLLGSDIIPHLHWWQTTAAQPNWLAQYRWQRNGQQKTTAWTDYPMTTNAYTWTTGTLDQITGGAPVTPPANYNISDVIQFRVIRDVANASGAFAGAETGSVDADATSFDYHFQIDTMGSRQAIAK